MVKEWFIMAKDGSDFLHPSLYSFIPRFLCLLGLAYFMLCVFRPYRRDYVGELPLDQVTHYLS